MFRVCVLSVEEQVERRRVEMEDLQRVDWMIEGICGGGFRSLSKMGSFSLLGFLNLSCSAIVEKLSAFADIIEGRGRERRRKKENKGETFACGFRRGGRGTNGK